MSLNFLNSSNGLSITGVTLSSTSFGFSGWINLSTFSTSSGPVAFFIKDNTTGDVFEIGLSGAFQSQAVVIVTPNGTLTNLFTATIGQWYFVALTISGTSYTAYWSQAGGGGTLNTVTKTDATAVTQYQNLWIGSDGAGDMFPGKIAAVNVWSGTAPTAAQIQSQMVSQKPAFTTGLFAQYPLLSTVDGNIDYSGNGHTMTQPATQPVTDTGPPASWT